MQTGKYFALGVVVIICAIIGVYVWQALQFEACIEHGHIHCSEGIALRVADYVFDKLAEKRHS
jgi:hypothetical protein